MDEPRDLESFSKDRASNNIGRVSQGFLKFGPGAGWAEPIFPIFFDALSFVKNFQVSRFIHYNVKVISKKLFSRPHLAPGPNFVKPRDACPIFFDALPFEKNSRSLGSSITKFWPFLKNNSFQDPIRPLVQILESPDPRVKYFLMLFLLKKFLGL